MTDETTTGPPAPSSGTPIAVAVSVIVLGLAGWTIFRPSIETLEARVKEADAAAYLCRLSRPGDCASEDAALVVAKEKLQNRLR